MLPQDKDRFWSRVRIAGPDPSMCWLWQGTKCVYGLFRLDGRMRVAHRLAYEDIVGPIPAGLVLDHLCRNPICVNPFHLEPVTHQVNNRRGLGPRLASERMKARHRARTHCKHGHPFTPENTQLRADGRRCRTCHARQSRERRDRKKHGASRPGLATP